MKNTRNRIVRAIALGLVGSALAFAHPTDPGVGSPTPLSEMRQEKLAFVEYRVARAAAERAAVQALTQACEEEAGRKEASDAAFLTFEERGVIAGLEAILETAERNGLAPGRTARVDTLDSSPCL